MAEIVCNGVDVDSGRYLVPPLEAQAVADAVVHRDRDNAFERALKRRAHDDEADLGLPYGTEPGELRGTGWAVFFPAAHDPAVRTALAPLLDHRREMAGERYRCFVDADRHVGGTAEAFLNAHDAPTFGPVDPSRVPYYVMIVGSPAEVPFSFQRRLGVQHAVGRLDLDTPDEYATYAAAVVRSERSAQPAADVYVAASRNPGDAATRLSSERLAAPLLDALERDIGTGRVSGAIGHSAGREAFASALTGAAGPRLAFTASHGAGFPAGDTRQTGQQGALITSDWQGPDHPVARDAYLAADDIHDGDRSGLVAFMFACFSGGTPERDSFDVTGRRPVLADPPFVAALAKRLLSLGALAVIGHVDRVWGYSFLGDQLRPQTGAYESCLRAILGGVPVGAAMEWFAQLHGAQGARLAAELDQVALFKKPLPEEIIPAWIASTDAGTFSIAGDPAVRFA